MAGTTTPSEAVATLPEAIATLKRLAIEEAGPDDLSAEEVISFLNLAWVAAERWRIEQELEFDDAE